MENKEEIDLNQGDQRILMGDITVENQDISKGIVTSGKEVTKINLMIKTVMQIMEKIISQNRRKNSH